MMQSQTPSNFRFKKLDFYILSNIIIDSACKSYSKSFRSNDINLSFIEYYFNHIKTENSFKSEILNNFYLCFNSNVTNFDENIRLYVQAKRPKVRLLVVKRNQFLSGLKAGCYIVHNKASLASSFNYSSETEGFGEAVSELSTILATYEEGSQLKALKEQYIIKTTPSAISKERKKATKTPPQKTAEKKVSKLIIPRLELSLIYPRSTAISRVDTRYFAYKLTNPADEVKLISRYHLKSVNIGEGFIIKRNEAVKPNKKSRFDDFF